MNDSASSEHSLRRRETALDMRRRLVAHVAAGGTTDTAPGTMENDRTAYTDPRRAELEKQRLFRELPLLAGLSGDVPEPGNCLLFDEVGPSILIVRGNDRRLRAFLNMCTHRGTRLVSADDDGKCPRRQRLTCPFHAWSFDLEGALANVPGREGFDGADFSRRRLVPVPVVEWEGLIFVQNGSLNASPDVAAFLGTFAPELTQLELGELEPVRYGRLSAETDWKLALDTYCEGYHFGTLHSSTIGQSHHSNVAVFDEFGPHWRVGFAARTLDTLVGKPESDWPEPEFSGVYFLFPNTIIVVGELGAGETCARVFRLFPGDRAGTMSCHISVYASRSVARDASRVERDFASDDIESEITEEDYQVATQAYRNLQHAPDGFRVVYGRNEPALQAFHRAVADRIADPESESS